MHFAYQARLEGEFASPASLQLERDACRTRSAVVRHQARQARRVLLVHHPSLHRLRSPGTGDRRAGLVMLEEMRFLLNSGIRQPQSASSHPQRPARAHGRASLARVQGHSPAHRPPRQASAAARLGVGVLPHQGLPCSRFGAQRPVSRATGRKDSPGLGLGEHSMNRICTACLLCIAATSPAFKG